MRVNPAGESELIRWREYRTSERVAALESAANAAELSHLSAIETRFTGSGMSLGAERAKVGLNDPWKKESSTPK